MNKIDALIFIEENKKKYDELTKTMNEAKDILKKDEDFNMFENENISISVWDSVSYKVKEWIENELQQKLSLEDPSKIKISIDVKALEKEADVYWEYLEKKTTKRLIVKYKNAN